MSDATNLTLLFTANINGRLDYLPRMATLIQRERSTAEGPVILLDGGSLCSFDVWPCAVTKMRAGRTMLEAMGYDAAALAGTDLLPLGEIGPAGAEVLAEMAGHYESVPSLNVSFSHLAAPLKSYVVLEQGGLRVGVSADWRPDARALADVVAGSVFTQPNENGHEQALAAMRDDADVSMMMTLARPSEPLEGIDIALWPDAAQSPEKPAALLVKGYEVGRDVILVDQKVSVCDESIPIEPTISAVLELIVEEASQLRGR